MAAADLGDAACWEEIWRDYIAELGSDPARRLFGELQFWSRTIRMESGRSLKYFPSRCRHICHDECMAVAAIAAAQAQDRAVADAAAARLVAAADPEPIERLWLASSHFAAALLQEGLFLYPVTRDVIDAIAACEERCVLRNARGTLH
jgi:hypothetical protein